MHFVRQPDANRFYSAAATITGKTAGNIRDADDNHGNRVGSCNLASDRRMFGSAGEAFEEAFETELDEPNDGITSTTEDVSNAGAFAIVVAIVLFLGAGLAKVALRTSLALLIAAMPMLIGLVAVDTTSLFAATYYVAILLVGAGVVLMSIAYWRGRRTHPPNPYP